MAITTYTTKPRANEYTDEEGIKTVVKDDDEVIQFGINWTGRLNGDTISSVTWVTLGPTLTSTANTSTTTTALVNGTGEVEVKVVTTAGQTLIERRRFKRPKSSGYV